MDWLRRIGRAPPPDDAAADEAEPQPVEGAAPGVAALLAEVSQDRSHAVLDLGPAADVSLRVYSRFARWVRFADLLGEAWWPGAEGPSPGVLRTVPPRLERPYDLVFAWDILDRLYPDERPRLVEWLADITDPELRLHVVVRASTSAMAHPLRFALVDVDRIRYEPVSKARVAPSSLLPAEVARLLEPLRVVHAFTLKTGFREYVAVRR